MVFLFTFLCHLYPHIIQLHAGYIEKGCHDHVSTTCNTYKYAHTSYYSDNLRKNHYVANMENNTHLDQGTQYKKSIYSKRERKIHAKLMGP